jgi:hypothetical protein
MSKKIKCFSKCKKLSKNACIKPCSYIDKTRKYCKLDSTRYYLADNCKITRKKNALVKHEAKFTIDKFLSGIFKKKRAKKEELKKKGKNPFNIIGKFMMNTTQKRRALFLSSICSDAGVCLAFGTESKKILEFFNKFKDFKNISHPIKRIGAVSSNGFVNEITYTKYDYIANAILKSSIQNSADNLMYEYYVGLFINNVNKYFPCFVETYGLYRYNSIADWDTLKDNRSNPPKSLIDGLSVIPINWTTGCTYSKYIAILIQHIKNAVSLKDMIISMDGDEFVEYDLINILYQIYMPLARMHNRFTHYDLHADNVLLYKPVENKYIQYHYHFPDKVVEFKSQYIAKMIDYGRSYFFHDDTANSEKTHEKICKTIACNPDCGAASGFTFMNEEDVPGDSYFITALKKNESHDLRLLEILNEKITDTTLCPPLSDLLERVVYGEGLIGDNKRYGTIQKTNSGLSLPDSKIYNVTDAFEAIQALIIDPVYNEDIYNVHSMSKLGDLHIYGDVPMKFTPN